MMVSRSYLQRNEWPGFCGFPFEMGTILGFSLNRRAALWLGMLCSYRILSTKRQDTSVLFFIVCLLLEWSLAYTCVSIETALMSMY